MRLLPSAARRRALFARRDSESGLPGRTRPWLGARARAALISTGTGLIAAILGILPFTWVWQEDADLYLLFHARGVRPPPADVVIVPIDQRAADAIAVERDAIGRERCRDVLIGETKATHEKLPPPRLVARWPRCLHGRVVAALHRAGASVIALDILFRPLPGALNGQRNDAAPGDMLLAQAMEQAGNVVLAELLDGARGSPAPVSPPISAAAIGQAPFLLPRYDGTRFHRFLAMSGGEWATPSMPALALQLQTLDLYPVLRSMLQREAPEVTELLPASAQEIRRARQLQTMALLIRHAFVTRPELAGVVRAELARAEHADLTPAQRGAVRALVRAYGGPDERYLNLYGPPGTIQALRYERILSGSDPVDLRGKVVFVGLAEYAEPEQHDHFATVWPDPQGTDMSGVELAATAFANLAADETVVPITKWGWFLIVFGLSSVVAWICFHHPSRRALLVTLAIALAYTATAIWLFERHALWLPMLASLGTGMPLGVAVAFTSQYFELKHQRQRLYDVLGLFVPRDVVEKLLFSAERLAWIRESSFGACVATDGERYTALAESLPPDQLAQFLNRYFQTLFPPITRHQGAVVDVVGDSMLAVWADTRPSSRVREQACQASLELLAAVEGFNQQSESGRLPTRIGVDYGPIAMTTLGAGTHFEYRPVGDVPNTANRLQNLNKQLGTRLIVSAPVLEGLSGLLSRDLGWFLLRGKRSPTRVFELLAEQDKASDDQIQMSAAFDTALRSFQAGRIEEARALFETVLVLHPGDGPAAFFAELCQRGTGFADGVVIDE